MGKFSSGAAHFDIERTVLLVYIHLMYDDVLIQYDWILHVMYPITERNIFTSTKKKKQSDIRTFILMSFWY